MAAGSIDGETSSIELIDYVQTELGRPDDLGEEAAPGGATYSRQLLFLVFKIYKLNLRKPFMLFCRLAIPIIAISVAAWLTHDVDSSCRRRPDPQIVPMNWGQLSPALPNPTLYISPSKAPLDLVAPTLSVQVLPDENAYNTLMADAGSNLTGAMSLIARGGIAQPVQQWWDGSFVAAQTDLSGETIVQTSLINLAVNAFVASRNSSATSQATGFRVHGIFQRFSSRRAQDNASGNITAAGLMVLAAFSVLPALAVIPIINERNSKAKHQQRVSGTSLWAWWMAYLIWDALIALVISIAGAGIMAQGIYQKDAFHTFLVLFREYTRFLQPWLRVETEVFCLSPYFSHQHGGNHAWIRTVFPV